MSTRTSAVVGPRRPRRWRTTARRRPRRPPRPSPVPGSERVDLAVETSPVPEPVGRLQHVGRVGHGVPLSAPGIYLPGRPSGRRRPGRGDLGTGSPAGGPVSRREARAGSAGTGIRPVIRPAFLMVCLTRAPAWGRIGHGLLAGAAAARWYGPAAAPGRRWPPGGRCAGAGEGGPRARLHRAVASMTAGPGGGAPASAGPGRPVRPVTRGQPEQADRAELETMMPSMSGRNAGITGASATATATDHHQQRGAAAGCRAGRCPWPWAVMARAAKAAPRRPGGPCCSVDRQVDEDEATAISTAWSTQKGSHRPVARGGRRTARPSLIAGRVEGHTRTSRCWPSTFTSTVGGAWTGCGPGGPRRPRDNLGLAWCRPLRPRMRPRRGPS